jgi:hypothetical protein
VDNRLWTTLSDFQGAVENFRFVYLSGKVLKLQIQVCIIANYLENVTKSIFPKTYPENKSGKT